MIDKYKYTREKLIQSLRKKNIASEQVLSAMNAVPRHEFIDSIFEKYAYDDKPFSIGEGQTISQPSTVAIQSTLLEVKTGDKILEIGTGSGYQAQVLHKLGAKVFSVERQKALFDKTELLLKKYGSSVRCFYRDGFDGLPEHAPFDKIIVTCGAPDTPNALDALLVQLKIGGFMIVPLDTQTDITKGIAQQTMKKIIRINEDSYETTSYGKFAFVPMLRHRDG